VSNRLSVVLVVAVAIAACAPNYYETYREMTPGWEPEFPRLGVDLRETVASVYAPHGEKGRPLTQIQFFSVFDVTGSWREIPPDAVFSDRFHVSSLHNYLILVRIHCSWHEPGRRTVSSAISWYYLPGNQLLGFEHTQFGRECQGLKLQHGEPPAAPGFQKSLERAHEA
jgi:hypothetical protein